MALVCFALSLYTLVLFAHVIFSWVPRPPEPIQPLVGVVRSLVDPVLLPVRRVVPPLPLGGVQLDLSIIVLFFGVSILRSVLC